MQTKEYRQSSKALIVSYLAYRIWLAIITYGILLIYDFLNYRNTSLKVHSDSLTLSSGIFSPKPRTVPYKLIKGVNVNQSALGRRADYGTVNIILEGSSILKLRFVDSPSDIASTLYTQITATGVTIQSPQEYESKLEEIRSEQLVASQTKLAVKRSGRCPRCDSDKIQAVTETSSRGVDANSSALGCCLCGPIGLLCGLPGAGSSSSRTRRMCLNCGKKF